jgi:hypothetical protein
VSWATKLEAEIDAGGHNGYVAAVGTVGDLIDRYVREVKPVRKWGRSKDY